MSLLDLFRRKPTVIGSSMHAWHWSQYGCAEIEGEVVDEDKHSYYLDVSNPVTQEYRAWRRVWKHDARPVGVALPIDTTGSPGT